MAQIGKTFQIFVSSTFSRYEVVPGCIQETHFLLNNQ